MAEVRITEGQIYQDMKGMWRWRTKGGNGEVLGFGEGYVRKEDAVAVLMAHLEDDVEIEEVEF